MLYVRRSRLKAQTLKRRAIAKIGGLLFVGAFIKLIGLKVILTRLGRLSFVVKSLGGIVGARGNNQGRTEDEQRQSASDGNSQTNSFEQRCHEWRNTNVTKAIPERIKSSKKPHQNGRL